MTSIRSHQALLLAAIVAIGATTPMHAVVERYKDEALYLARLAELSYATVQEDFEGDDWSGIRSTISQPSYAASITSKRLVWDSIGGAYYPYHCNPSLLATNTNWARGAGFGIYDTCIASTLRVTAPEPVFGIGFWVNTNPDGQDVGILFPDRTTANDPGYVVNGFGAMYPGDIHPFGHGFVGFIDPEGFTSVVITGTLEVNEENQLEGGTTYGADDFTFAVAPGFRASPVEMWRTLHFTQADLDDPAKEATVWGAGANPDRDALTNDMEFALGTDPNDPADGDGGIVMTTVEEGGYKLLTLTFRRRNDDPGLVAAPQLSENAASWSSDPSLMDTVSIFDQGDGYELVTVKEVPASSQRPACFGRVDVTRLAP